MTKLKNINFMSKERFDSLSEVSDDELYAVRSQVVVETYRNGTEWYRVYSDGWIEQGGVVKKGSSLGDGAVWDQTITFLKPFENINYSINAIAGYGTTGDTPAGQELKYKSKTESSIIISLYNRNASTAMSANIEMTWEVKGQGA